MKANKRALFELENGTLTSGSGEPGMGAENEPSGAEPVPAKPLSKFPFSQGPAFEEEEEEKDTFIGVATDSVLLPLPF